MGLSQQTMYVLRHTKDAVKNLCNATGVWVTVKYATVTKQNVTATTKSPYSSSQTKKQQGHKRRLMVQRLPVAQRKTSSPHSSYCGRQMPPRAQRSEVLLCHIWCATMQTNICAMNAHQTIKRKDVSVFNSNRVNRLIVPEWGQRMTDTLALCTLMTKFGSLFCFLFCFTIHKTTDKRFFFNCRRISVPTGRRKKGFWAQSSA